MEDLDYHQCKRADSWEEYDAQGIEVAKVCEQCVEDIRKTTWKSLLRSNNNEQAE